MIEIIKDVSVVITTVGMIFGGIFAIYRWYLKKNAVDADYKQKIESIENELTVICQSVRACLDGLEQLGANHDVTRAKSELDKHLNKQAHNQK